MPTENHEFNTPGRGETDWNVLLNENAVALDTLVEVRDLDVNRNEYAPKDGAKYLATDTGVVYLGDGSAWNALGRIGDVGPGGADIGTFDARRYGGTDGGERIQAALDHAAEVDPAVVVVAGTGPDDVSGRANATCANAWFLRSALEIPSDTTSCSAARTSFLTTALTRTWCETPRRHPVTTPGTPKSTSSAIDRRS